MQVFRKSFEFSKNQKLINQKYRPDIEGMRAVAVVLVIFAHFSIPGFSAGFIGVDVFFVISGYLMTRILVEEYEHSSGIRLTRFYANRLRRLFPALLFVLLVSSIFAYYLLPVSVNLSNSIAAASAVMWVSNLYFAFSDVDYFSDINGVNVFLHTWSLGVEEQFYILWPILILFFIKISGRMNRDKFLGGVFLFIFFLSFVFCIFLSKKYPILSYYMMPTRAWQFSSGALVWIFCRYIKLNDFSSNIAGWLGVLLLCVGMYFVSMGKTYPGFQALIPTLSACALLVSGENSKNSFAPSFLSKNAMQFIGGISYSWYLWHWPVLVLGEIIFPVKGNVGNTVLAILASFLLAVASLKFVENPVRFGQFSFFRHRWQIISVMFLAILVSSQFLRWNIYSQELNKIEENSLYVKAKRDVPVIYQMGCDDWFSSSELKPCVFGKSDAKKTAILLGDSIGVQWFPTLKEMLDPENWKIVILTKSSCPMVDEKYFYQRIGREYTECTIWREKAIDWINSHDVDYLFFGSTASSDFSDEQWRKGTARILDKLSRNVGNIYLIESNPVLGFNGPDCLQTKSSSCVSSVNNPQYSNVASILKEVASHRENVHWIETSSLVCPGGYCHAMRDGVVVYRDQQHLTASFAAKAAKHFADQM